jgi:hypothetical protein
MDTLSFTFHCKLDSLLDIIAWGEAALMYENKNKSTGKINIPAKDYIIRPKNIAVDSLIKDLFYIQILASKTIHQKEDIANLVHLQEEHIILELKTGQYYRYFIGCFSSGKQASAELKYYRQYMPDAFILRYEF